MLLFFFVMVFVVLDNIRDDMRPKHRNSSQGQTYIDNVIEDMKDTSFRLDSLLACIAALFWFKVLYNLRLTRTFGPQIKMVITMIKDIGKFAIVWMIQLLFFACVGVLMFQELNQYKSIMSALIELFTNAMGIFDYTIYNKLENPWLG